MPLGEFEARAIRNLLNEANQIRRRAKLKGSILKAGDDKTAPAEPEMLSQLGTIIKRIRGKTDPEGAAELGLNEKKAVFSLLGRVAAGVRSKMVPGLSAPLKAGVPTVKAPTAARLAKPPSQKFTGAGKVPRVGATREEASIISRALGNDPDTGWQKLTAAQALAMLKMAIDPATAIALTGGSYGLLSGLIGGASIRDIQISRAMKSMAQAERARRIKSMLIAGGVGAGAGAAAASLAKKEKK
jgi:hypothetical protein